LKQELWKLDPMRPPAHSPSHSPLLPPAPQPHRAGRSRGCRGRESNPPRRAVAFQLGRAFRSLDVPERLNVLRLVRYHIGHAALVDLVLRHPARLHALGVHQRLRARLQLPSSARRALYKAVLIVERIVIRHNRHLAGCFQSTPFGRVCPRPPVGVQFAFALKGRGFSRADKCRKLTGALAPEGKLACQTAPPPVAPANLWNRSSPK